MRVLNRSASILRLVLILAPVALFLVHDFVLPEPWHTHPIEASHGFGETARDGYELRRALRDADEAVSPEYLLVGDFNAEAGFAPGSTPAPSALPLNRISKPAHRPPLFLINGVLRT